MKKFHIAKARRLRGTPFSSRIESQDLTAYTTYNHMLLPAAFEGTEKEYWDKKTPFELEIKGKKSNGLICDLPFEI